MEKVCKMLFFLLLIVGWVPFLNSKPTKSFTVRLETLKGEVFVAKDFGFSWEPLKEVQAKTFDSAKIHLINGRDVDFSIQGNELKLKGDIVDHLMKIVIYDIFGSAIFVKEFVPENVSNMIEIPKFSPGVYFIKFINYKNVLIKKLCIL